MILKERQVPEIILKLQAILERLPIQHEKIILLKNDLSKFQAGFNGEKSIDFYLQPLLTQDFLILHDIRIPINNQFFQIDTLILTKKYILILEIKNLAGTINFDGEFNQAVQTKNGKQKAFPDPLYQLNRQETMLRKWLDSNQLPILPIHGLVVMSNVNAVIRANHEHFSQKVIRPTSLSKKIKELEDYYIQATEVQEKQLKKITKRLLRMHTPLKQSILDSYGIAKEEIIMGVCCERCHKYALKRRHGRWKCNGCSWVSKDAHKSAMNDYCLLFGEKITSKELQAFLKIDSPSLATRLFRDLKVQREGDKKSTIYTLEYPQ
ncbi:NERD domain-containing protein [Rossellomorea aquimaris]|uniref:nuclease-related domain-containing protein n=1 Tax=Rossellomorea aquimaris TaxID=189382 RepID=UPI001CD45DFB|nr:nuclease-related domain-containing protein [Rossellomorea aquimaris]MCA1054912.1 NERD domain-containing protein [Rossellomorea aquimaris]